MMLEQATAATPDTCADCGAPVVVFRIHAGFRIQLDDHDVPVTVDITDDDVRHRLWQYFGPRLGWAPQFSATRTWRPLRTQHECAAQQLQLNKEKIA